MAEPESRPVTCTQCGRRTGSDAAFCSGCGTRVETPALADPRFATPLGYTPEALVRRVLATRGSIEGERKTVTALFVDVVGSTGIAERIGAEAMSSVLGTLFARALDTVHHHEGIVTQFLGDGFLALFGAPLAHEEHPELGVRAAWSIQEVQRESPLSPPDDDGRPLRLRIGLHTGEVVIGRVADSLRMEYTAIGDTINTAARLEALCRPGAVFLSEPTRSLLSRAIGTQPVGELTLEGRSSRVGVHQVVSVGAPRRRDPSHPAHLIGAPLVGRNRDFAALERAVGDAGAGAGGVVLVGGEAGVGKSRLLADVHRVISHDGLQWLEGRTLSFGKEIGYWPFLEILKSWAGLGDDDSDEIALKKLTAKTQIVVGDRADEVFPYVATMLGLPLADEWENRIRYIDRRSMGAQISRSVRRLVERMARDRPLVLVFEDLHWADASSCALITHLVPLTTEVPLLLICVSRPGDDDALPPVRTAAMQQGASITELQLGPLGGKQSAALLERLLGHGELADRTQTALLARAGGNPFFLEELVRALVAEGKLSRDDLGRLQPTGLTLDPDLPATIQGVILARFDRLDEHHKEALRTASVVGRVFLRRVLEAVSEAPAQLDTELAELTALELIRERRTEPEVEFIFKHALVHEATYGSILGQRRRGLHERVATSIERLFADRLEEFYGLLAHHYASAESWDKAEDYLRRAADEAGRIAANTEAFDLYQRALERYGDRWSPTDRARVERSMGEALFSLGRHGEALGHMRESFALLGVPYPRSGAGMGLALTRQIGRQVVRRVLRLRPARRSQGDPEITERTRAYQTMGWMDYFEDPLRLTFDAFAMLNEAERAGDEAGIAMGSCMSGLALAHIPVPRLAEGYFRRAFEVAERSGHPVARGDAHFQFAMHKHFRGDWSAALEHYEKGEEPYWAGGHLRGWGACITLKAWVLRLQGRFHEALREIDRMGTIARESGDLQLIAWHEHTWGHTLWRAGHSEAAAAYLERAIDAHRAIPCTISLTLALADLAECRRREERFSDALALLAESEQMIKERQFRGAVVWIPPAVRAQVQLDIAEREDGVASRRALAAAASACRRTRSAARVAVEAAPAASRLAGTHAWLRGRHRRARSRWDQSAADAHRLGAHYELALTEIEAGTRLGDGELRESGLRGLASICSTLDINP